MKAWVLQNSELELEPAAAASDCARNGLQCKPRQRQALGQEQHGMQSRETHLTDGGGCKGDDRGCTRQVSPLGQPPHRREWGEKARGYGGRKSKHGVSHTHAQRSSSRESKKDVCSVNGSRSKSCNRIPKNAGAGLCARPCVRCDRCSTAHTCLAGGPGTVLPTEKERARFPKHIHTGAGHST